MFCKVDGESRAAASMNSFEHGWDKNLVFDLLIGCMFTYFGKTTDLFHPPHFNLSIRDLVCGCETLSHKFFLTLQ